MVGSPETVICPGCGSENPKISQCVQCGDKLPVLNSVVTLSPKDFVQKPRGLWFFIFLMLAGFMRSCMGVMVASNIKILLILGAAVLIDCLLLYGLWKLKPWARYGMLFLGYMGMVYSVWAYIEVEVFVVFVIKVLIPAIISGAMVVYFHLPRIKHIFEEEPRGI